MKKKENEDKGDWDTGHNLLLSAGCGSLWVVHVMGLLGPRLVPCDAGGCLQQSLV